MSEAAATGSKGPAAHAGHPNVTVIGEGPKPINPNHRRGSHRVGTENFMETDFDLAGEAAAEEAAAELGKGGKNAKGKPNPTMERPGKRKAEPEPEPDDEEETQTGEDEPPDEAAREADEEVEQDPEPEEQDEAPLLPPGKGSRENPLTLKDIPKDKFVKLKVDGKTTLVNLADALEGTYIRPESFHRLSAIVKSELVKGQHAATEITKRYEALQGDMDAWISDPDAVLESFLAHDKHEQVLYRVLNAYLEILKAEKADPDKGLRRRRERDQRHADARQRALDEREQSETRTREMSRKQQELMASWKPGLDAGLEAAGFPDWDGNEELREETGIRLERRRKKNGQITAKDWEECVIAAAAAVGAKPVTDVSRRPTPPPRSAARPEPRTTPRRPSNGQETVVRPFHERMRTDNMVKSFFRS